jgi:hypothetical protein
MTNVTGGFGSAPQASTTVANVIVPKGNFGPYPSPKRRKRRGGYGQQITDEHTALVLGQGHPKSKAPK